ncbi:Dbp9p [Cryptosporidium bovis]|uniref:Dbp9p n=1 Tax=Cryptosporidium bovis TaxID=310047 RepID=UPI00351A03D6|nr:Dbp9p [Cryptosporidium bovis]
MEDWNKDSGKSLTFSNIYGSILDRRLVQSLTNSNFIRPTKVQIEVIKKVIEGKDLLINSFTGSGKTLAYAIPICHSLLNTQSIQNNIYALILVPSKELVMQTYDVFEELLLFCGDSISVGKIFDADDNLLQKQKDFRLSDFKNNILISTPGDILKYSNSKLKGSLFREITYLVVDEADLLFAFGYDKDMNRVLELLPNSKDRKYQCILLSATLTQEVDSLNSMLLHKPIFIDIKPDNNENDIEHIDQNDGSIQKNPSSNGILSEYYTTCKDAVEKWLMLYILLKMNVVPRKCLIFVSIVDTAYSIKLFLEKFGISCGVLTQIIPAATRRMIIQCFNQGTYDILVACDSENDKSNNSKLDSLFRSDSITYRGVDYKEVASVFNFDCPSNIKSYIHHIGRTARGGSSGVSITIFNEDIPNEMEILEGLLNDKNRKLNKLKLTSEEVSCFRYRIEDCMRILTKSNIQKHKLQEIQGLVLNNTRLLKSGYFSKHPSDKNVLRSYHKHITNAINIANSGREHIKNIPDYLYDMVNNNLSEGSNSGLCDNAAFSFPSSSINKVYSNNLTKNNNFNEGGTLTEKVREAIKKMGGKEFQFVRESNQNPLNITCSASSRNKRVFSRKLQLKKEPKDYSGTVPDELPAISGRKLWKLRHKKHVKKYKDFVDDNKYRKKRKIRR